MTHARGQAGPTVLSLVPHDRPKRPTLKPAAHLFHGPRVKPLARVVPDLPPWFLPGLLQGFAPSLYLTFPKRALVLQKSV